MRLKLYTNGMQLIHTKIKIIIDLELAGPPTGSPSMEVAAVQVNAYSEK